MATSKYKKFSNRLIDAMKIKGYTASRSPSGVCIKSLSKFSGASEQICRRYIRGDALPNYEKIEQLASYLQVAPGWLLFGEQENLKSSKLNESILHYILKNSHHLYPACQDSNTEYADFVLELFKEVSAIDTSESTLFKIIDVAIGSVAMYEEKNKKYLQIS